MGCHYNIKWGWGLQDFSVCHTWGGLGRTCLWLGSAAHPGTPAPPACHPQLLAALAHLTFISASLLPSCLQDQPGASPSRFKALQVSILQVCCSSSTGLGMAFLYSCPLAVSTAWGWLMGMCVTAVMNGSQALLKESSLFLQKCNHLGKVPTVGGFAPLPILLVYWSSRGVGWGQWLCKLFSPIHKKRACRGTQAINLHLLKEKKLKTLKQFIAF